MGESGARQRPEARDTTKMKREGKRMKRELMEKRRGDYGFITCQRVGLADGAHADAIPNVAGGEGGHGAAKLDGVIHRYCVNDYETVPQAYKTPTTCFMLYVQCDPSRLIRGHSSSHRCLFSICHAHKHSTHKSHPT
jgi:hypothetical protein